MAKLPDIVKKTIDKISLVSVATADKNGIPNVVIVTYIKCIDDETVLIVDNKFDKTRTNLEENNKLAFVIYDPDIDKSYQVKGRVDIVTNGELFQSVVDWVHVKHPHMNAKAAVVLHVEEVYSGSQKLA